MLKAYANQNLSHEVRSATKNAYNEYTYSSAVIIKGRKESSNRLIRTATGEEKTTSTFVMTHSIVSAGDKIDGRIVLTSDPAPNLAGVTEFYEVYLA
jgi:hypothetical protein